MSTGYDPYEHRAADRLTQRYPGWLVMWGAWSRLFWAYPRFGAPPGTIVHAATPTDLITLMGQAELAVSPRAPHPPQPPAGPFYGHPPSATE